MNGDEPNPIERQVGEIIANAHWQDSLRNMSLLCKAAAQMWQTLGEVGAADWARVTIIQNYLDSLLKYAHMQQQQQQNARGHQDRP